MRKMRTKQLVVSTLLLASSLYGGNSSYEFKTKSLVGIEGGYSDLNYEFGTSTNNVISDIGVTNVGLKIGAETDDFRVFLSGRYFYDSSTKYEYIVTYGAEIQYKFNMAEFMNAYIGANAGVANVQFRATGENFSRTISDPYVGGDIGVNIHVTDSMDWEIGARVMSIQADNIRNGITYHINQITSGYTSIIFKWEMD